MKLVIELFGEVPSKKNQYRAVVKKSGKAGLVKDRKMRAKYDYLVEQVPVEFRDLNLKHPRITIQRFCPLVNFSQDRDGIFTTILDEILVRLGIIEDDSDIYNNGQWVIESTKVADAAKLVITLETSENVN